MKEFHQILEKKAAVFDLKKVPPQIDDLKEKLMDLELKFTKNEKEEREKDKAIFAQQIKELGMRVSSYLNNPF
jgi:hypothetical protein